MLSEYRLGLEPLTVDSDDPDARAVLQRALSLTGFVPNMYARLANLPSLLDIYLSGQGAFRSDASLAPSEQEVVFLTISRENGCEYCVSAHSFLADKKSGLAAAVTDAIRTDQPIPDEKLAALSRFTRTMVRTRGLPTRENVEAFLAAGYTERHILAIILAIAVKTISNYANHLFHTPLDQAFEGRRWSDTPK